MTHQTAMRQLASYADNSLNGASLDIRAKVYECLAVLMPTAKERNEWRRAMRDGCEGRKLPAPDWARIDEML